MIVKHNNTQIKLPDFLIVGAARSGTTTLYSYLSEHPQIFMPYEKEPMFFSLWDQDPLYYSLKQGRVKERAEYIVSNLDGYLNLFRAVESEKCIGEASSWYLYSYQRVISNIKKLYGEKATNLKIIAILRNPVDRAWSHFMFKKGQGRESLDFNQAINPNTIQPRLNNHLQYSYDYIGFGRYYEQIKAFRENFPLIKIFIFEDFIQNMSHSLSEICQFLSVDSEWRFKKKKRLNVSGKPKNCFAAQLDYLVFKPNILRKYFKFLIPAPMRKKIRLSLGEKISKKIPLDDGQKNILIDVYKQDIEKLAGLLKTDLAHWMQ